MSAAVTGAAPLCLCGCGLPQLVAKTSRPHLGYRVGEHVPFRAGHRGRIKPPNVGPTRYQVDDSTGCWVWQGRKNNLGYGRIRVRGRSVQAHRVAYELARGPIPEGLVIDHLCRNRACVNPDHMEPVTNIENIRRGLVAKLTKDQVRFIRRSSRSTADLAAEFGVAPKTILDARRGTSWRDIDGGA